MVDNGKEAKYTQNESEPTENKITLIATDEYHHFRRDIYLHSFIAFICFFCIVSCQLHPQSDDGSSPPHQSKMYVNLWNLSFFGELHTYAFILLAALHSNSIGTFIQKINSSQTEMLSFIEKNTHFCWNNYWCFAVPCSTFKK